MTLPDYLQPFLSEAKSYLEEKRVKEIEFSGPTYQVEVRDKKSNKDIWAFLQLNQSGNIKDCFCSCEDGQNGLSYCPHLAAAFLRIYNDTPYPLHVRFENSLWNQLCRIFSDRLGESPQVLEKVDDGFYVRKSVSGKNLFSFKGLTKEMKGQLDSLMTHRKQETETTSLKFSNLPLEELLSWREGRPSAQLRYELSFWNDLAHLLMRLQEEGKPYQISFEHSSKQIPNQLTMSSSSLEASFYLSESSLAAIVPFLGTVNAPLKVYGAASDTIDQILYDANKGVLKISSKKQQRKDPKQQGQDIGGWVYVFQDGFHAKDAQGLLSEKELSGEQVSEALTQHTALIEKLLKNTQLHHQPVELSYQMFFDPNWNLHIIPYIFSPGDLTHSHSRFFDNWVYLDNDGFHPVAEPLFHQLETVIDATQVGDFVTQERGWLNTQDGFHTHMANIEAQLSYSLGEDNRLRFTRKSSTKDESQTKDFGAWIYLKGQGFYSKVSTPTSLPIRPDISLSPEQIPLFIRANRAELQIIPNFFSNHSPVATAGLIISLTPNEEISITPHYDLLPEYESKSVTFFDDFTYIPGEGFEEMPPLLRLPEKYRHQVIIQPKDIPTFLAEEFDSIKHLAKSLDSQLIVPKSIQLVALQLNKAEKEGWGGYAVKFDYKTEYGKIHSTAIWEAIQKKKRFLFSQAGCLDLSSRQFDWLRSLPKSQVDKRSHVILLSTLELIRLHALDPIHIQTGTRESAASQQALKELTTFHLADQPDLSGLNGELRSYQQLGIHWLWFLYRHNLSGLLCDEMGLGKTHQAMALIAAITNYIKQADQNRPVRFLIICPTSVIYHWQEKIQSYLPHFKTTVFHGLGRRLEALSGQHEILLTSYGIWRMEHEQLSKLTFDLAILDEIQIAKNQTSRVHHSLRRIKATMRLGMTGTPIENRLREMKSLFDLVLPGYMPNETDYRELFIKPIEKEGNGERRELLSRYVKPFILRRKKADVLPDLPEKIVEVAHCDLSEDQQILYNSVLLQSRETLIEQLKDSSYSVPFIHIFSLLSQLKQICDHPAVFYKTPQDYKKYSSGKWELFLELFNEARESHQKVVIFSQYLTMLDIFEEFLNERGISFATIRGATIKRGEEIRRFNKDPHCQVFLGSIQAAGLGVDLTAGSVVFHYDRWWNAAREDQATDRVHRIGQTRGVQVFKLVTKRTFEERIDELINKKARLMEEVVGADDHRFIKAFDREELLELLETVSQEN